MTFTEHAESQRGLAVEHFHARTQKTPTLQQRGQLFSPLRVDLAFKIYDDTLK